MRFPVPLEILDKLRVVRDARAYIDEIEEREDAFLLDPGLGPSAYLTADGRVLIDPRDYDAEPLREATEDEAISYLVVGARKTGVGELLALLPAPAPGSKKCARCEGRRWVRLSVQDEENPSFAVVCGDCSGRGWTGGLRSI